MFVGWSFVLLKETHRRSTRRRKKSSRPTTENTQTSLRFRVLNLRALISSRARFSLFREALLSRRRTEEKKKRKEEQNDTETTASERRRRRRREEKKSARRRDIIIVTASGQLLGTKNGRCIFHLGFSKWIQNCLREKYAENNTSSVFFFRIR